MTTGATVGLMDIHKKCRNIDWINAVGMDKDKLPFLLYAEEQAGMVTEKASIETGYFVGTPVYAGTGDAGATTLASGIASDGEFNINIGTSGWVASVSSDVLPKEGVFNLAAMPKNLYINNVSWVQKHQINVQDSYLRKKNFLGGCLLIN